MAGRYNSFGEWTEEPEIVFEPWGKAEHDELAANWDSKYSKLYTEMTGETDLGTAAVEFVCRFQ